MTDLKKALRYRRKPIQKAFHRITEYWLTDASFVVLLFILIFIVFILPVLIEYGHVEMVFVNTVFLFLFFTGIFSSTSRLLIILTSVLFFSQLFLRILRINDLSYDLYLLELIVGVLNMMVFIGLNIRILFRDNEVNLYRVFGAVNVYLLLAVLGAFLFETFHIITGSSISSIEELLGNGEDYATYVYFSLVSLTTVGFGDIYPVQIMTKMLSVFLSTIGILYPAVVIAKLVSGDRKVN